MLSDNGSSILNFFRRIVNPAKPPSNIVFLVILRVVTVLLLFTSMVTLLLSILSRPWKSEMYQGKYVEIGMWTICRFDSQKLDIRCFDDFYKENDGGPWFESWRYLLVASMCLKVTAFAYLCIELTRLSNKDRKPWVVVSYTMLLAALASFCSLILFYIKFEFEFIEDELRLEIMGWNEETGDQDGFEETIGLPYNLCWISVIGSLLTSYISFYSKCEEDLYIKEITGNNSKSDTYRSDDYP